jgi:enoyl-CoA hydratase
MSDIVTYEVRGRVALITLNRPEARNAVNGDVAGGLEAAIDRMEADDDVWIGILTANTESQERPVFSAGADLKALNAGEGAALSTERGGFAGFVYRDRRKPVIVAVDGLATAGGCEIVLAADLVVATTRSAFGLAEVKRNLIAGAGGLFRLPRAIGQAAAMEAILTGEPIPAPRAYELGLVSRLVEPGQALDEAFRLADQITANAPLAVWASRRVVLAAAYADDETLKRLTNEQFATVLGSEDTKEGLTAFIEKRPPNWKGR